MWNLQYHQIQLAPSTWKYQLRQTASVLSRTWEGQKIYGKAGNTYWAPCLFQVIYVTEHGENNYYQKGFGAENPRMKHNPNKFTMLLKKNTKDIKFSASEPCASWLQPFCWSAGRQKTANLQQTRIRRYPLYGYTRMFENVVSPEHQDHAQHWLPEIVGIIPYREMIYTGPIDEFFDYRYGKLPYHLCGEAWNAQHARASTSGSRELSQWAFVYQRSSNTWPDKNT